MTGLSSGRRASAVRPHESRIVGDGDVGQPVIQPPLLIDLTKVPNRML